MLETLAEGSAQRGQPSATHLNLARFCDVLLIGCLLAVGTCVYLAPLDPPLDQPVKLFIGGLAAACVLSVIPSLPSTLCGLLGGLAALVLVSLLLNYRPQIEAWQTQEAAFNPVCPPVSYPVLALLVLAVIRWLLARKHWLGASPDAPAALAAAVFAPLVLLGSAGIALWLVDRYLVGYPMVNDHYPYVYSFIWQALHYGAVLLGALLVASRERSFSRFMALLMGVALVVCVFVPH